MSDSPTPPPATGNTNDGEEVMPHTPAHQESHEEPGEGSQKAATPVQRPDSAPDPPPPAAEGQHEDTVTKKPSSASGDRSDSNNGDGTTTKGAAPAPVLATPAEDIVPVLPQGEYPIDPEVLAEVIERRSMTNLQGYYGGVLGFASIVKTNPSTGITADSIEGRREALGANELSHKEPVTFIEMLADAFGDRVIQILTVAAIISIIFGLTLPDPYSGEVERSTGWIKGTAIIISVLVVTMTGAIQNYKKAKQFEEIEREQAVKTVSVLRDGHEASIDSTDLVVGDVLILETGMEMTCDGLLLRASDLRTNESPITGEPDLIEKSHDKDVFIVSGTSIEEGTGVVMVVAVGMNSFRGKLKEKLSDDDDGGTPLEEHLTELGDDIGVIGLIFSVGVMLALCLKEVILITTDDKEANAATFLAFVIIAITLIAVAIPEGLPLAVTISLAFAMRAMMSQGCMVRVLASCETMGAATAVCSDKTGTLTTNEMTVVQALIAEEEFVIDQYGVVPRDSSVNVVDRATMTKQLSTSAKIIDEHVALPLAVNSTARQQKDPDTQQLKWVGNKTEAGILGLLVKMERDFEQPRKDMHETNEYKQFPFSSIKKRMTTALKRDGKYHAYIKGASEAVLRDCDRYLTKDGSEAPLSDAMRQTFTEVITDMAMQGNRTIGFGYNVCTEWSEAPEKEPEELKFVFVGVLGIQDPIRPEVPDAVRNCESAHLTVRMVTGDNIDTAKAISKKCGLYDEARGDIAMTGEEFRKLYKTDQPKLEAMLPQLRVLARSSPSDKHTLVGMLQDAHGEVVGVTGDGTNDAPALKLADVGFAMYSGTDIAKGAADMVLLDDNFATVVTAIKWGRSVNDNIKKFLQYQLAINFAGVGLTVIGSLASETSKEPIAPVQLLWLNLIMDTLAALSLATELPEEACLARLPVFKQAPLITNKMRTFIGVHGAFQFTIIILLFFLGHKWFDTKDTNANCEEVGGQYKGTCTTSPVNSTVTNASGTFAVTNQVTTCPIALCQQGRVHTTMLFNTFIWFQIFNVFNSRKIYGELNCFEGLFDRSRVMLIVFFVVIVPLQVIGVELGGDALATTGLSWDQWLICIGFGASEWVVGLIVRLLPVEDYVPTKEEIIEGRREEKKALEEKEAEKKAKEEEIREQQRTIVHSQSGSL